MTSIPDGRAAAEPVRTEQTLRRMWQESIRLATNAQKLAAEAEKSAQDAAAAEKIAHAHRTAERETRSVADAMFAEAYDLMDIVNAKRADAGMPPLDAGEPYDPPADEPPGPVHISDADLPVATAGPGETGPMPATQDGDAS